jgi:hypothetical protein
MESSYVQKFSSHITWTDDSQNSAQWLESALNEQYIPFTKQSDGVYFCVINNSFVVTILIDNCTNPTFLQAGFLCTMPHCLISEHPVYSNTIGSAISYITEFTSGAKNLTKEMKNCFTQCKKVKTISPFACVVPAMPVASYDKLIMSRSDDAIYINDIVIVNKRAILYDVLNILIEGLYIFAVFITHVGFRNDYKGQM